MDVGGRAMSYYHSIAGIARVDGTDLGKNDIWVPITFLLANIVYDIGSFILSDDTVERYFGVLFGEEYYESRW
jgi:hypothetical protein